MNIPSRTAVPYLPEPTTAIGMAWIGLTVYERLWAATRPLPAALWPWNSALVTLIVAWSVLARKRWGRFALLWIASATACSGAIHLAADHLKWASLLTHGLLAETLLAPVPGAADHNDALSATFFTIAVISLVWLTQPNVRAEFEARKARATAGFQHGIAAFLAACWISAELLGTVMPGRDATQLRKRADTASGATTQRSGIIRMVQRSTTLVRPIPD
ncbi:MAG: hypothetical protein ACP5VE_05025 [Chthonomonadales bacterium]